MLYDKQIKKFSYSGKPSKHTDGNGLYLYINKSGKYWRYDYRLNGKRKTYSLGVYPALTLEKARKDLIEAKAKVKMGLDPTDEKRREKFAKLLNTENSFQSVAIEWLTKQTKWADSHRKKVVLRLENDVYPVMGKRPIADITSPEVLLMLRKVEARGAVDSAHRIKQSVSQVFRYAVVTGRCETDPTISLKGALEPVQKQNYPTLNVKDVGGLLRAINGFERNFLLKSALLLGVYTAARSGEIRAAEWSEFNIDEGVWEIPADRMKNGQQHQVYLSTQVIAILLQLKQLTGEGRYLFPGFRSPKRPISGEALNAVLRELGYSKEQLVFHSFRSIFSTICNERLEADFDVVEKSLAHVDRNQIRAAYNRSQYKKQRQTLMQQYADYLDELAEYKADVIPITGR